MKTHGDELEICRTAMEYARMEQPGSLTAWNDLSENGRKAMLRAMEWFHRRLTLREDRNLDVEIELSKKMCNDYHELACENIRLKARIQEAEDRRKRTECQTCGCEVPELLAKCPVCGEAIKRFTEAIR